MTPSTITTATRDIAYQLHPFTNLSAHENDGPMVITRGEGVWVWDDAGKRYLEGLAGLWCTSLGFSKPRLVEAAPRQLRHCRSITRSAASRRARCRAGGGLLGAGAGADVEGVLRQLGLGGQRHAIKLVRYYNNALGRPDKKKIISRRRAYHGVTSPAASLTGCRPTTATSTCRCRSPAHRMPASLSLRPAGRERGGIRHAARRRTSSG